MFAERYEAVPKAGVEALGEIQKMVLLNHRITVCYKLCRPYFILQPFN